MGDDHPVVYVNHTDAEKFCEWLSERENKPYRLPTEAEWEYAARGTVGRIHPWAAKGKLSLAKFTPSPAADSPGPSWRETVGDNKAAPNAESGAIGTAPVGGCPLGASPFGIEDLVGNVWEWCEDFYGRYGGSERTNPHGPQTGAERVCRGGSWKSPSTLLKATTRGFHPPGYAANDVGFRVVCDCTESDDTTEDNARRIEGLGNRLQALIEKEQAALNELEGKPPGFLTLRKAKAAWAAKVRHSQERLLTLRKRSNRLELIKKQTLGSAEEETPTLSQG